MTKNKISLKLASFSTVDSTDNPDVLHFTGTVCYIDMPSDYTPNGGVDGYNVVISSQGLDIDSLVGKGVDAQWGEWYQDWDLKMHNPRFKIGVIDKAWIEGNALQVEGHLWKYDFDDICDTIECAKESLGFSVEAYFDNVSYDKDAKIETGIGTHFTGVAILYKNKAAFQKTNFMCNIKEDGMGKEELEKLVDDKIKTEFAALAEKQKKEFDELKAMFNKGKEEPKKEPTEEPKEDKAEFAAMVSKAVSDGIAHAMELGKKEPTRKTSVNFGSIKQFDDKPKTVMELSKAIDEDQSLTPEQRWSKKMELWEHRNELNK